MTFQHSCNKIWIWTLYHGFQDTTCSIPWLHCVSHSLPLCPLLYPSQAAFLWGTGHSRTHLLCCCWGCSFPGSEEPPLLTSFRSLLRCYLRLWNTALFFITPDRLPCFFSSEPLSFIAYLFLVSFPIKCKLHLGRDFALFFPTISPVPPTHNRCSINVLTQKWYKKCVDSNEHTVALKLRYVLFTSQFFKSVNYMNTFSQSIKYSNCYHHFGIKL